MPFKKWLEKHGLNLILPLFYETQTSQGYGYIEEVPTYYGTAQPCHHYIVNDKLDRSVLCAHMHDDTLCMLQLRSSRCIHHLSMPLRT